MSGLFFKAQLFGDPGQEILLLFLQGTAQLLQLGAHPQAQTFQTLLAILDGRLEVAHAAESLLKKTTTDDWTCVEKASDVFDGGFFDGFSMVFLQGLKPLLAECDETSNVQMEKLGASPWIVTTRPTTTSFQIRTSIPKIGENPSIFPMTKTSCSSKKKMGSSLLEDSCCSLLVHFSSSFSRWGS